MALNEASRVVEGKTANIYTDSWYTFGIAHDYGPIWKARQFLTSAGQPIKNFGAVQSLMKAFLLSDKVAVLKVKAHTEADTGEPKGNTLKDGAAKAAARKLWKKEEKKILTVQVRDNNLDTVKNLDIDMLRTLQLQASKEEKDKWTKMGATEQDGVWRTVNRNCLPPSLYPMMAQLMHRKKHLSKAAMMSTLKKGWVAPGFSVATASFVQSCMICAMSNLGKKVKVPQRHLPRPLYPFQRLQIDYIQLPPVGKYEYVLVVVDVFSGWVEAYPVTKATMQVTAKKLMNEVICRCGVLEVIESDKRYTLHRCGGFELYRFRGDEE
ncbi:protein NYNRIN-like [Eleutherodactylus coqui]|uniref:protein NYNRIN-like n=1 Tax=Eleutherodactylus coqui TaxID=57060 RepID=UPI003461850A